MTKRRPAASSDHLHLDSLRRDAVHSVLLAHLRQRLGLTKGWYEGTVSLDGGSARLASLYEEAARRAADDPGWASRKFGLHGDLIAVRSPDVRYTTEQHPLALYYAACEVRRSGKVEQVMAAAERACAAAPGFSEAFDELGRARWEAGDAAGACAAFCSAELLAEWRAYPAEEESNEPQLVLPDYFGSDIYFGAKGYYATHRVPPGFRGLVKSLVGPKAFQWLRPVRNAYLRRRTSGVKSGSSQKKPRESLLEILRRLRPTDDPAR